MKQWIRWSGLIGFTFTLSLLAVFFLFAGGPLIKASVEHFGSQAAGAQVNVGDVSLSFNPLGVNIGKVQVTDSEKPMENLLEFSSATAELELAPLFLGKGIIRDLSVSGLQFNTPRAESGRLDKAPEVAEESDDSSTSEEQTPEENQAIAKLPSVDDILAREPLKTEQVGKDVQQSFEESRKAISEASAAIPDSQALARYEDQLKKLLSSDIKSIDDFKQRKKKLEQLKTQFKQDKAALAQARQVISHSRKELSARLSELKGAPGEDLNNIRNKYNFDAQGAANISALLFGDQAGQWAEKALYWYEKVKPYLASEEGEENPEENTYQRSNGQFVHFPSDNPWPEFLIRKTSMSAPLLGGTLQIEGTNITHQQDVIKRPAKIVIQGNDLTNIEDLTIDAVLDHRQGVSRDSATLDIKDWAIHDINLGVAGSKLASALVQVQGLAVVNNSQLQAKSDAQINQAAFSGSGRSTFAKELNGALSSISSFDINASAQGELTSPSVNLGSNLDKRLNDAFQQRLKSKQKELEEKLRQRLDDKVAEYLGDYAADIDNMNNLEGTLQQKGKQLSALADSKLEDFEAQQKRKIQAEKEAAQRKLQAQKEAEERKLRAEKEAAQKKLAEEKRKAEEEKRKAEAKAREKQRELERKAKDKIKNLF